MYIPKSFDNNNLAELQSFIETYSFATLITNQETGLQVSHVPMMLDKTKGQFGTLVWHLAKLNEHSEVLNGENGSLCIFHGPHSYISPAWYKSSTNVPTWNYAVVHAHGIPMKVRKDELASDLEKLVIHHESLSNTHYKVPENYKARLLEHIDGFHMQITQLQGKFKLGQNRVAEDQQNMLAELLKQKNNYPALDLARFILQIQEQLEK